MELYYYCFFLTLFFACKREGDPAKRRSGELTIRVTLAQMPGAQLTHPDIALLVYPLSGKPERG